MTFGPVPSRRLGRSLGINNIPPKICSYSCGYCQVGRTLNLETGRRDFFQPEEIFKAVRQSIKQAGAKGEVIDYLSFVPDGEPTLDINLGHTIELLRPLGIKIAVITNSSLIGLEDVRHDLQKADWVSIKFDSVIENIWRSIDHPARVIGMEAILTGAQLFSKVFTGELVTETMLVKGINDGIESISRTAAFIGQLKPERAYLSIPTRPPADRKVQPPDEDILNRAFQIFSREIDRVEYLIGYEGNVFSSTGNIEQDLLNITAVHPMREEAVAALLERAGANESVIHSLLARGLLIESEYGEQRFYVRRFPKRKDSS